MARASASNKPVRRLSLVSWNINSVRLRVGLMARLKAQLRPDLICLQEIKCRNQEFPKAAFQELGYRHFALNGIKAYHGVAIVSRRPFAAMHCLDLMGEGDGRHVAVRLASADGLWVHNFYVPAGGDIADAKTNPKFAYKLAFLDAMTAHFRQARHQRRRQILVGDLNTAPGEHDVWSHKQLLSVVCHTPMEVRRLRALQATQDWQDIARHFVPPEQKLYSWWSYRARDWERSDRGRRLDHIWTSPALRARCTGFAIAKEARNWPQPSDHVPVYARFAL